MSVNALYTDLSGYYDLMCVDIDYQAQSNAIRRLHQLFGNDGTAHLDLACGTGPHVRHFIDFGYASSGLDINQPMLDIATTRCSEAHFTLQDMSDFKASAHRALKAGGVFYFNGVDKQRINNDLFVKHTAKQGEDSFTFRSGWHYSGHGERQSLRLSIEKTSAGNTQVWNDEHPMVAVSFIELTALLTPYFEVHVFEHNYETITPWDTVSGNAIFVCVKK